MHDLPLLNPACLMIVSKAGDILAKMMRLNILHVNDSKVMPRLLLQFPKSPFFGCNNCSCLQIMRPTFSGKKPRNGALLQ